MVISSTQKIASVTMDMLFTNTSVKEIEHDVSVDAACVSNSRVSRLVQNLIAGSSDVVETCGNFTWLTSESVVTISNVGALVATISPCGYSGYFYSSTSNPPYFVRALVFTFIQLTSAPVVHYLNLTAVTKSSVTVLVTLYDDGYVMCAALPKVPTAVVDVLLSSMSGWSQDRHLSLSFSALLPVTSYYVSCVTQSKDGLTSSLQEAINATLKVTTSCCKSLVVALLSKSFTDQQYVNNALSLTLNAAPSISISVEATAHFSGVDDTGLCATTTMTFYPSPIAITSQTSVMSPLILNANPRTCIGVYSLNVTITGPSSLEFTVEISNTLSFEIIGSDTEPPTPVLSSARFNDDGSGMWISFDSPTDKGMFGPAGASLSLTSSFACSTLFHVSSATTGTQLDLLSVPCQWSGEGKTVTILANSYFSALPGDFVTVLPNLLRAACPPTLLASARGVKYCKSWNITKSSSVSIAMTLSPTAPVVSISSPGVIGSCDSLVIDVTESTGNGGRKWAYSNVSLAVSHTGSNGTSFAALQEFVASSYFSLIPPTPLPAYLLNKNVQYVFTVTLCNFLGACAQAIGSTLVVNQVVPFVSLMGSKTQTTRRSSSSMFSAVAFTATCDGAQSSNYLVYAWAITSNTNSDSSTLLSTSRDPTKFILPAYLLHVATVYTVTVTVTNTQSLKSSQSAVTLAVLRGSIVAIISGGSAQSFRQSTNFSLSASSSFDEDVHPSSPSQYLNYEWTCYGQQPIYTRSCPLALGNNNLNTVAGTSGADSLNTVSVISILVFDNNTDTVSSRQSTASVSIAVLPTSSPLVFIVSSSAMGTTKITQASNLLITAKANMLGAGNCTWSVDSSYLQLATASLTKFSGILSYQSSTSALWEVDTALVVAGSMLPSGQTLTFKLTCTVSGAQAASSTSITVQVNQPPQPGLFSLVPHTGEELNTIFVLTASLWTDTDVPMQYEFSFYKTVTGTVSALLLQGRSRSTAVSSTLPAGSAAADYVLMCSVSVFDSFGSNNTRVQSVTVRRSTSLNSSTLQLMVAHQLSASEGNADGTRRVLSTFSAVLNTVNCSLSPNCTNLHRYDCSGTANTCGACMTGKFGDTSDVFVGTPGDSNDACVPLATVINRKLSSGSCTSNDDCGLWMFCNTLEGLCVAASKVCPGDCSGHGPCIFVDTSTNERTEACAAESTTCVSRCQCSDGYFGLGCDLSVTELAHKQYMREQLLEKLVTLASQENVDDIAVKSWLHSLSSVTGDTAEVDSPFIEEVHRFLASITVNRELLSPTTLLLLLNAMDSIANYGQVPGSGVPSSRRLDLLATSSETQITKQFYSLISNVSASITTAMATHQYPQTMVGSSFRLVAQSLDRSAGSAVISLPRTSLESVAVDEGTADSRLRSFATVLASAVDADLNKLEVAMVSVPTSLAPPNVSREEVLRKLTATNTSGEYVLHRLSTLSNPLVLQLRGLSSCRDDSAVTGSETVYFRLYHSGSQSYGPQEGYTAPITHSVICRSGELRNYSFACPGWSQNLTLRCNGTEAKHSQQCPVLTSAPYCHIGVPASLGYSNQGIKQTCRVANYTPIYITCACTVCLDNQNRRLSSADGGGSVEATSVTVYAFEQFQAISSSAMTFDSVADLRASLLVVIAFLVLWGGSALVVGSVNMYYTAEARRKQLKVTFAVKHMNNAKSGTVHPSHMLLVSTSSSAMLLPKHQPLSTHAESLSEVLSLYLTSFFPVIFKEDSSLARISQILWYKHRYFNLMFNQSRSDSSHAPKTWIYWLEALSELTVQMYLLALFYSIQWPSDDGTCSRSYSLSACLAHKSMFDSTELLCSWSVDSNTADGECLWVHPSFHPFGLVVISLLVVVISAPLNILLVSLFKQILLAPTKDEINSRLEMIHERRKSAVQLVTHRRSVMAVVPAGSAPGVQAVVRKSVSRAQAFTQTTVVDVNLEKSCMKAQKSANKLLASLRHVRSGTKSAEKYNDDRRTNSIQHLCSQLARTEKKLKGRDKEHFSSHWQTLCADGNDDSALDYFELSQRSALQLELNDVDKEAQVQISRLGDVSSTMRGISILLLFVCDLLGRNSRESKIFHTHMNSNLSTKFVVTWGVKCLAVTFVCMLNAYLIFTCMLYGRAKGMHWQVGWIAASVVNLLMDMCIKQVNISFIIYFLIPNTIYSNASSVRYLLRSLIQQLCDKMLLSAGGVADSSKENKCDFNAADYLFVSSRVARAYPGQLESQLVLAYQSRTVSARQSNSWNSNIDTQFLLNAERGFVLGLGKSISFFLSTCLLTLGSKSLLFQHVLVNTFNPLLIGVVAFVGISLFPSARLVGIPVVLIFIAVCVIIGMKLFGLDFIRTEKSTQHIGDYIDGYENDDERDRACRAEWDKAQDQRYGAGRSANIPLLEKSLGGYVGLNKKGHDSMHDPISNKADEMKAYDLCSNFEEMSVTPHRNRIVLPPITNSHLQDNNRKHVIKQIEPTTQVQFRGHQEHYKENRKVDSHDRISLDPDTEETKLDKTATYSAVVSVNQVPEASDGRDAEIVADAFVDSDQSDDDSTGSRDSSSASRSSRGSSETSNSSIQHAAIYPPDNLPKQSVPRSRLSDSHPQAVSSSGASSASALSEKQFVSHSRLSSRNHETMDSGAASGGSSGSDSSDDHSVSDNSSRRLKSHGSSDASSSPDDDKAGSCSSDTNDSLYDF
jgi:hypothetical protein